MAERFHYFNKIEEGLIEMCKIVEERVLEGKIESIKEFLALGKLTHEEIARCLNVPIDLVENIANGKVA